jgi:hypothetical protein
MRGIIAGVDWENKNSGDLQRLPFLKILATTRAVRVRENYCGFLLFHPSPFAPARGFQVSHLSQKQPGVSDGSQTQSIFLSPPFKLKLT